MRWDDYTCDLYTVRQTIHAIYTMSVKNGRNRCSLRGRRPRPSRRNRATLLRLHRLDHVAPVREVHDECTLRGLLPPYGTRRGRVSGGRASRAGRRFILSRAGLEILGHLDRVSEPRNDRRTRILGQPSNGLDHNVPELQASDGGSRTTH